MSYLKQSPLLGIQAVPSFAREATLIQNIACWDDYDIDFPAARSIYNIAALAFYPRLRMQPTGGISAQTLGVSFWSHTQRADIKNIFGVSKVAIPQGAEYFAVAWITPPDASAANGPFPETLFRVVWGLSL